MKRSLSDRIAFLETWATQMRTQPTGAEAVLWTQLKLLGFGRQIPVIGCTKNGGEWNYIADFLWSYGPAALIVEVDGGVHNKTKGRDRRRDSRLAGEGIKTIRFSNKTVLKQPDDCRRVVELAMEAIRAGA